MKHLFLVMLTAITMTAAAQDWQYCEVQAFPVMGSKWKTVFHMDTIAPPPGIDLESVTKWKSNVKWISKFAADSWELVTVVALTGQYQMLIYTFKRKNLTNGKK